MTKRSTKSLALLLASSSFASASTGRHHRHRDLAAKSTSYNVRQTTSTIPLGGFQEIGDSGVSAQMMFLGSAQTVYILDSAS